MTISKHSSIIFSDFYIISKNFENGLLEQINIEKYTVGNLNNIDIDEDIVTLLTF